jgi:hypothetical protein
MNPPLRIKNVMEWVLIIPQHDRPPSVVGQFSSEEFANRFAERLRLTDAMAFKVIDAFDYEFADEYLNGSRS